MSPYVRETYGGWDEKWQRQHHDNDFATTPPDIISVDGTDVGVWSVSREPMRLVLRKIYLLPQFQRKGLGTKLLQQLIRESEVRGVPIELRYLRVDPVGALYERLGFKRTKEEGPHVYLRRAL